MAGFFWVFLICSVYRVTPGALYQDDSMKAVREARPAHVPLMPLKEVLDIIEKLNIDPVPNDQHWRQLGLSSRTVKAMQEKVNSHVVQLLDGVAQLLFVMDDRKNRLSSVTANAEAGMTASLHPTKGFSAAKDEVASVASSFRAVGFYSECLDHTADNSSPQKLKMVRLFEEALHKLKGLVGEARSEEDMPVMLMDREYMMSFEVMLLLVKEGWQFNGTVPRNRGFPFAWGDFKGTDRQLRVDEAGEHRTIYAKYVITDEELGLDAANRKTCNEVVIMVNRALGKVHMMASNMPQLRPGRYILVTKGAALSGETPRDHLPEILKKLGVECRLMSQGQGNDPVWWIMRKFRISSRGVYLVLMTKKLLHEQEQRLHNRPELEGMSPDLLQILRAFEILPPAVVEDLNRAEATEATQQDERIRQLIGADPDDQEDEWELVEQLRPENLRNGHYTVDSLKALCRRLSIKGFSKLRKAELQQRLLEWVEQGQGEAGFHEMRELEEYLAQGRSFGLFKALLLRTWCRPSIRSKNLTLGRRGEEALGKTFEEVVQKKLALANESTELDIREGFDVYVHYHCKIGLAVKQDNHMLASSLDWVLVVRKVPKGTDPDEEDLDFSQLEVWCVEAKTKVDSEAEQRLAGVLGEVSHLQFDHLSPDSWREFGRHVREKDNRCQVAWHAVIMGQTTSVLVNVTDTLCTRMLVVDFDRGFLGSVEREIAEPYTEGSPHNLAWIKAAFEPGQEHRVFKTASDLSIPVQLIEELRRLESKGELGHAESLEVIVELLKKCISLNELILSEEGVFSNVKFAGDANSAFWNAMKWMVDVATQLDRATRPPFARQGVQSGILLQELSVLVQDAFRTHQHLLVADRVLAGRIDNWAGLRKARTRSTKSLREWIFHMSQQVDR
mmetsp:Transcript_27096/g.40491  ORF Transcript_27096/g.40491 Transcript_27096/m.40491 type:complete len:900 (-) Transcript_27096:15-2714(-)